MGGRGWALAIVGIPMAACGPQETIPEDPDPEEQGSDVFFDPDRIEMPLHQTRSTTLQFVGPDLPEDGAPQPMAVRCRKSDYPNFTVQASADGLVDVGPDQWTIPNDDAVVEITMDVTCTEEGPGTYDCSVVDDTPRDPLFPGPGDELPTIGGALLEVMCTPAGAASEICDNGIDDDGDLTTDCDDADCRGSCTPDPRCNVDDTSTYGNFSFVSYVAAEIGADSVATSGNAVSVSPSADIACGFVATSPLDSIDNLSLSCDDAGVYCADGANDAPFGGSHLVTGMVLAADFPADDGTQAWQYGWYLKTDPTGAGYQPPARFSGDPARDTDLWVFLGTSESGWQVTVYDVDESNNAVVRATSDVRVIVTPGGKLFAVLPVNEVPTFAPSVRMSAYCGQDFGSPRDVFTFDQFPFEGLLEVPGQPI
ncbi:MAG: hypothetical protein AAF602_27510 [Myxococcota bacterium]